MLEGEAEVTVMMCSESTYRAACQAPPLRLSSREQSGKESTSQQCGPSDAAAPPVATGYIQPLLSALCFLQGSYSANYSLETNCHKHSSFKPYPVCVSSQKSSYWLAEDLRF